MNYTVIVFCCFLLGFIAYAICMNTEKRKIVACEEAKKREIERDKEILKFYKECKKEYVQSLTTKASLAKLEMVAARFDLDLEEAKKYYLRGKELLAEEKKKQELEKREEERKKEMDYAKEEEKDANVIGLNKYIASAMYFKNSYETLAVLNGLAVPRNPMYEKRESTIGAAAKGAFWGGTAVGVANAMRVQSKNESRAQRQKDYYDEMHEIENTKKDNLNRAQEYDDEIKDFEHRHEIKYSDTDIDKHFEGLSFSNVTCSFTKHGNIQIDGDISLTKKYSIKRYPAVLDGSLKITVLDEKDRVVGEGYYCAPGKNQMNISRIGFSKESALYAVCIPKEYDLDSQRAQLHCKIEPHFLWLIREK